MVSSNRWTGGVRNGAGGEDTAVDLGASDLVGKSRHSSAGGPLTQAKGGAKRASTGHRRLESPCGGAIFFSSRHAVHRRCTVLPQDFHRQVGAGGPLTLDGRRHYAQILLPSDGTAFARLVAQTGSGRGALRRGRRAGSGPTSLRCSACFSRTAQSSRAWVSMPGSTRTWCAACPSTAPMPPSWCRLRADSVDWVRTDDYTVALRAARYAEARGEHDFAELSGEVARLLNEVGQTTDNARRLGLALEARRRLSEWPARHHNYRASDVQQILQLVDDAISDFRAAAGAQQFDLALHAAVAAPDSDAPAGRADSRGGGGRRRRRRGTDRECRRAGVAARGDRRDHRATGRAAAASQSANGSGCSSVSGWRRNTRSTRPTPGWRPRWRDARRRRPRGPTCVASSARLTGLDEARRAVWERSAPIVSPPFWRRYRPISTRRGSSGWPAISGP